LIRSFVRTSFELWQYVWRAALASRLRVASLPRMRGESLSRASVSRTCVALNRATGALGLRVRSRFRSADSPPLRWFARPSACNALRPLSRRASRGVALRSRALSAGGSSCRRRLRRFASLCTARGRRFGGAPLAPRLAACGMSLSRPPRRAASGGGSNSFFPPPIGGRKKESL